MAVLLVEDDFAVRLTLAEFLEAASFQVLEAEDANEALSILADPMHRIDILVTDLGLGAGDNGLVLSGKAKQLLPNLQVIYATGSPEKFSRHILEPWERVFFKPFNPAALVAAVSALDRVLGPQRCAQQWLTEAGGRSRNLCAKVWPHEGLDRHL